MKIIVTPSPTADTRTCDRMKVTKDELLNSSVSHIDDVRQALTFLGDQLRSTGKRHDHDKISDIDGFYRDFRADLSKIDFVSREWYQKHIRVNRHHLDQESGVPDDVNLIDVLEMLADCSVAGMARSGSVYPIELSDELLQTALQNTLKLLIDNIVVSEVPDTDKIESMQKELVEIEQVLGKALGYPAYKDDPSNFPGATDEDGVCVGAHTAGTLAIEAAEVIDSVNRRATNDGSPGQPVL